MSTHSHRYPRYFVGALGFCIVIVTILVMPPNPMVLLIGSGLMGFPIALGKWDAYEQSNSPHLDPWEEAIQRYFNDEIDDIDLDLEGDYILRGICRPSVPNRLGSPNSTTSHHSSCTCPDCYDPDALPATSSFSHLEKKILSTFSVPPNLIGPF